MSDKSFSGHKQPQIDSKFSQARLDIGLPMKRFKYSKAEGESEEDVDDGGHFYDYHFYTCVILKRTKSLASDVIRGVCIICVFWMDSDKFIETPERHQLDEAAAAAAIFHIMTQVSVVFFKGCFEFQWKRAPRQSDRLMKEAVPQLSGGAVSCQTFLLAVMFKWL